MLRTRKILIVSLAAGALTVGTAVAIDKRADPRRAGASSKELVEAAQGAYEECLQLRSDNAGRVDLEDIYTWSKRWMTAAQDFKPGEATKAVRAHFDRMSDLEKSVKVLQKSNLVPKTEIEAVRYYRAEAELMLSQAGD